MLKERVVALEMSFLLWIIELLLEKGSLLVPVKEENREVWGEGSWRL